MFVPFFSVDSEIVALSKIRVLFLIKRLRNIDLLILVFIAFPFLVNFVYYILFMGANNPLVLFNPAITLIQAHNKVAFSDWYSISGFVQFLLICVLVGGRIMNGRILYIKMVNFQNKTPGFKWTRCSKFWLMIFLPFFTFSVYPELFRLTNFEVVRQYNL